MHISPLFQGEIETEPRLPTIDFVRLPKDDDDSLAESRHASPPCRPIAVRFFDDESLETLRLKDPSRLLPYSGAHKLKLIRAGFRQLSGLRPSVRLSKCYKEV